MIRIPWLRVSAGALALLAAAEGIGQDIQLKVFPGAPGFPGFPADALGHRLSLGRSTDSRTWMASLGWEVAVVQMTMPGATVTAGVGATVITHLRKPPGHLEVETVDYRVDIPVDVQLGELSVRTGIGHISSHLVDDAIEIQRRSSIQSVKDYVFFYGGHGSPFLNGHVYAGVLYVFHILPVPDRPWIIQAGGQIFRVPVTGFVSVYGAFDLKLKQEIGWGSTQSYQAGLLVDTGGAVRMRIAYTHRRGYDDRGQLFDLIRNDNLLSVSLEP